MTTNEALIKSQFIGIRERWNNVRAKQLCRKLGWTMGEFQRFLLATKAEFNSYLRNKFPGAACKQMEDWENYLHHKTLGETPKVLPDPVEPFIAIFEFVNKIADEQSDHATEARQLLEPFKRDEA